MRIAIIGAGNVGRTLGGGWSAAGHSVVYGVRDTADPAVQDLAEKATVADCIVGADAVLISLRWPVTESVVTGLDFGNAIVIDATNPLVADASHLDPAVPASGAELVRDWTGSSRVVKAFNTTGSGNMGNPAYGDAASMMLVASDDPEAKAAVIGLANDLGLDGVDAGPLAAARDLEHVAMLWIRMAYMLGNSPDFAFSIVRR